MREFIGEYIRNGFIKEEKVGFDQVLKHLARARKDVKVAKANLSIDSEASYNYAYLAMLRSGRALMLSCGFRPSDGEQHKTVVYFCEQVLEGKFSELVRRFDRMRKKRNRFTYDEPGLMVSDTETHDAVINAQLFVEKISDYIQNRHPQKKLW